MHPDSNVIGAMTRHQFARMLELLAPYRHLPAASPVLLRAARQARQEVEA